MDKTINNLRQFQAFFRDSNNKTIIDAIKHFCRVGWLVNEDSNLTGEMFAYRAGRQDVWNNIQELLNKDIEQEKKKLENHDG